MSRSIKAAAAVAADGSKRMRVEATIIVEIEADAQRAVEICGKLLQQADKPLREIAEYLGDAKAQLVVARIVA